ncbi:MAG: hypothetical protein CMN44_04205 [SAR116 cluster bacterium]|nr:hypothetical protein [SAR116 cluster bacterium]RPH10573.1 MAG: OmpA family protein [Alphaproteobacteria bacterium TMED54]|tara:strand:+ start:401 stop:1531 length:1131 start_codon:yes stop_codon:yes gene_type:complete
MNTFKLRRKTDNFIWPSFVDALASLLIVIIFILMIFVIAQYYISQKLSGKDQALIQLQTEIREISNQLTIEKDITKKLSLEILNIQKELDEKDLTLLQKQSSIKNLQNEINMSEFKLNEQDEKLENKQYKIDKLQKLILEKEKNQSYLNDLINKQKKNILISKTKVDDLTIIISNLKDKIEKLNSLLDDFEKRDKKQKVKNLQLKSTLNSALARRVEELQKFKSIFFGTVKDKLKNIPEIKIVGDRFVFQSEVLFKTGSINIEDKGEIELKKFAEILISLDEDIPQDSNWILQIEGHTDNLPVKQGQAFKDNWELSTKRALSVLRFFIKQGIDPKKLFASGYGSFQPIDNSDTKKGRTKNRRIEMKITQKLNKKND